MQRQRREEMVGGFWNLDALGLRVVEEQDAERHEEKIHEHHHSGERVNVLLGLPQRAAAKVLLHHVLIETRHDNRDEDAAEKLLPEIVRRAPVPEERLRHLALAHRGDEPAEAEIQLARDGGDGQHHAEQQEGGLEGVRPDERLDAAAVGVGQNQRDGDADRQPERDVPLVEDEGLKDIGRQEQSGRRARRARQNEEQRTDFLRMRAEALTQVAVDGGEVQPVIEREQDLGDHDVANDVAEDDLQIGELIRRDLARHGDERDAGERIADEPERDGIPRRRLVTEEVRGIARVAAGGPGNQQQEPEVTAHAGENQRRRHSRGSQHVHHETQGKSASSRHADHAS